MRRRWAWLAVGSGIVATTTSIACGPTETTCEESATCPPGTAGAAGAGGSSIDAGSDASGGGGGGGDGEAPDDTSVTPDADASVDRTGPDETNMTMDARDVDARSDLSSDDTRRDVVTDVPVLMDQMSEPDACDPGTSKSPAESACLISEKYGVFVSPQGSDATGVGTRSAPYKTLAKALQTAKGNVMRVYACDEGAGYVDALTIDATLDGMSLYGGFECTGWTYATTRRSKVHPASGTALTVKNLTTGLTVEAFEFVSADAATGASSIAAVVDTALNVVLREVRVVAGKGGGGANGADGGKGVDGPAVMGQQSGADAMCPFSGPSQPGGGWSNPACGSQGGNGGPANKNSAGGPGSAGSPGIDNQGSSGATGGDGGPGSVGNAGASGSATTGTGLFTATGYSTAPAGGDGAVGNVGQGGGGGGASNAVPLSNCIGASGGAGGMGGCGGDPGTGGASAGASVALLAWNSPITLDHCDLVSGAGGGGGNGGKGGKGGLGKPGGSGGAAYAGDAGPMLDAGVGLGKGGNGGTGGNGGNGGSGAGGNGGPTYAIVYKGTAPTKLNSTTVAHGAGGAKGTGGSVDNVKAPDGLTGLAADDFAVP